MLDVHSPEHAARSWRDFFIHIGTIVLGLLIAIGLEQTVEALHHRHQRAELRASLRSESAQIAADSATSTAILDHRREWIHGRIEQLQIALWKHQRVAVARPVTGAAVLLRPDDPLWRSAKTSGMVTLLSENEVSVYSELERLTLKIDVGYDRMVIAHDKRLSLQHEQPYTNATPDFSRAQPEELHKYLSLLTEEEVTITYLQILVGQMRAAIHSVQEGSFDPHNIQSAENLAPNPS